MHEMIPTARCTKRHLTAKRFLSATQLFTLAESLGGIESSAFVNDDAWVIISRSEGSFGDLMGLSVGVEEWVNGMCKVRLDGLLEARSTGDRAPKLN